MELDLKDGMCRCCASEGSYKDFTASYQWMGVEEVYSDMLKDCFDITLSTSNMNNGGICEVCITQLRNAFNFKKQVLNTEEQFKKLQENLLNSDIVKIEEVQADVDDTFEADDMDADFSGSEYDLPIKLIKKEKYEESKPKKRTRASTSKSKKNSEESGETSAKRKKKSDPKLQLDRDNAREIEEYDTEIPKFKHGQELEKHRRNIREIITWSNATPIRSRGGIGYACCFCADQYPDPADLKRHTIENHDDKTKSTFMKGKDMYSYFVKLDITSLTCNICFRNMDTLESIMVHLKTDHDKSINTDIKNQILPFKFDSETLRCFICLNVFNKFKALQEHMHTHYRNFICDVCDAGFVNRHILLCHREAHKTGTFACDQCTEVFETVRKMKQHVRKIHNGLTMPHKCGYCSERFKENFHKYEHLAKVHGVVGPAIKCQACDRTFTTQQTWLLHTKKYHLMQKQHKCSYCDKAFFGKRELNDHIVKHTGTREYRCEVCFKCYGRMKTLKEHMRRLHSQCQR